MGNVAGVVLVVLFAAGCWGPEEGLGDQPLIRVAAASDLADALPEIIRGFEAGRRVRVEVVYGSSGQLAKQVESGAPIDVFLSADRGYVDALVGKGLVEPGSVRPYALGALALIAREEMADQVRTLEDLGRPTVRRIAIANPDHAPYGRAAREVLEESNLWAALEEKLVLADTVRQAVQFVDSGNADAGLVSRSLVIRREPRGTPIEASLHSPLVQALGVVVGSNYADEARSFAEFVIGDEARSILSRHGLASPPRDVLDGAR